MHTFSKALLGSALGFVFAGMASAQDDCSTPVAAILGPNAFDNTANTDSGFTGAGAAGVAVGADYFFSFSIPADGDYTFDTCGSTYDTEIGVYSGVACAAVFVDSNDDGGPCTPQSTVDVVGALTGDNYLIAAGGWNPGVSGVGGVLNVAVTVPPPPAPANDTCATPDVAILGANPFDSTSATDSVPTGPLCSAAIGRDLFYTYTVAADGDYTFDTCGSSFDTEISVSLGADCNAVCIAANDDGGPCTPQSTVDVVGAIAGEVYFVRLGGWNAGTGGAGVLNIGVTVPPPPAPSNDTCATPLMMVLGANAYDNTSALSSGFDGGGPCSAAIGQDIFFTFVAGTTDQFQFDTCGTANDTRIAVHLGADCSATCIDDNDDNALVCGAGLQSALDVALNAGDTVLIQIGGFGTSSGPGNLNISVTTPPPPAPSNDTCATPLMMVLGANAYDNTSALSSGFDGGGPCSAAIGQDIFFTFVAGTTDQFLFDTCGTANDTRIAVHLGADCAATCLADNDDNAVVCGPGLQSALDVALNAGDTVLIQIGGFGGSFGPGTLNISVTTPPPPPPANDDCSTAIAINAEGAYPFNNEFATTSGFDGGDPVNCMSPANIQNSEFGASADDVFWAFTVPCDGDYSFDTAASPVLTDTRLSLHLGADCTATCIASNDDIDLAGGNYLSQVDLVGLVVGDTYLVQVGMWNETQLVGDGVLTITNLAGPCPTSSITIGCDPASPHYLGGSADLSGSALGAATPSGLHIECTGGPAGEFGFMLVSTGDGSSLAIFNGVLCLDSPQGRYNPQVAGNQGLPTLNSVGQFDGAGILQNLFGNAATSGGSGYDVPLELPFSPAGQMILPGSTWAFQCWFRDQVAPLPNPGSTANFSNSILVQFS